MFHQPTSQKNLDKPIQSPQTAEYNAIFQLVLDFNAKNRNINIIKGTSKAYISLSEPKERDKYIWLKLINPAVIIPPSLPTIR